MENEIFHNLDDLNYLKLPFISKMKKIINLERQINSLNEDIILLKKSSNASENLEETIDRKEKKNINTIRKSITSNKIQRINFLKKSKSSNKLKLYSANKNTVYKSSKNLIIKNIITFQNKKNISPNTNFNIPLIKENEKEINNLNKINISIPDFKLEVKPNNRYVDNTSPSIHRSEFRTKSLVKLKKTIKSIKFNDYFLKNDIKAYEDKWKSVGKNIFNYNLFNFQSIKDKIESKSPSLENSRILNSPKLRINFFNKDKKDDNDNNNNLEIKINDNENQNITSNNNSSSIINSKFNLSNILSEKYPKKKIPKILIKYVKDLRSNNLKINRDLKFYKLKFDEINFRFGTKLKYSKWKYSISDYEKYFIDIEHFGEREKKEIERKKTFYDILEDAVDSITEKQNEKKYLLPNLKRKKIYEQPVKNNNKIEDKKFPDSELMKLNLQKLKNDLEILNIRIAREKERRSQIKDLLEQSFRDANDALKI